MALFDNVITRHNKYGTDEEKKKVDEYLKKNNLSANDYNTQNALRAVHGTNDIDAIDAKLKERQKTSKQAKKQKMVDETEALNAASTPDSTIATADTLKKVIKPEEKKVKPVVKKEEKEEVKPEVKPEVKEEVTEKVTEAPVNYAGEKDEFEEDNEAYSQDIRDYAIKSQEEAQDLLKENGVEPETVDTPEGAKTEMQKMVNNLAQTGLFDVTTDKNGNIIGIKYKGMDVETPTKMKVAGTIGKVLTALSIIGAIYTGGKIPPMNLTNAFKSDEDIKAFDAKIQQSTNSVNSILGAATNRDAIKAQTESAKELKGMDQEFAEMMKDKEFAQAMAAKEKDLENQLKLTNVNFANQKEMAQVMADIQAELPAKTKQSNIIAMQMLKDTLGPEQWEAARKTLAEAVAADMGKTPAQLLADTTNSWIGAISAPITNTLGAIKP